jgi:hypothetical protein
MVIRMIKWLIEKQKANVAAVLKHYTMKVYGGVES